MNYSRSYIIVFMIMVVSSFTGFGRDDSLNWSQVLSDIRREFSDVHHLSVSDLANWVEDINRTPPVIFDAREDKEYIVSHIPHARYLNPHSDIKKFFKHFDRETPIVVYCSVGYRSSIIARKLQKLGFLNVYNLEGSIFAWANKGHPIVRGDQPAKYVHPYDFKWGRLLNSEYRYEPDRGSVFGGIMEIEQIKDYKTIAFIIGLMILLLWETYQPFMDLFQRNFRERSWHGIRNVALGMINAFTIALCFVLLWLWAAEWADQNGFGVLNRIMFPPWAHALGAILLFDFFTYWFHRFSHEIPFFWRFHRVHHSDLKMDVTTANRFHVGEIVISSLLRIPAILIFGARFWELLLYELIMFPIVQFHHANIAVPERLDRFLRIFIVTPAMHKVHHSRIKPETNSNYTSLLSIWDRIFGSFRLRADPNEICYGLDELDNPQHQDLSGLLKTPWTQTKQQSEKK